MAKLTEKEILKALTQVRDPDLNRDIVSLGFVKNLKIKRKSVQFDVELTTPACPVKDQLKRECEEVVSALGEVKVSVNMTSRVRASQPQGKKAVPGVRNLVAVASGKGGVGKSTLCMNLALALARSGARVGLMDCDFYGPSVPAMVGVHERVFADREGKIIPHQVYGLKLISMGFLVERNQGVAWRGPMLHKMVQQFLYGVDWGELDYLMLDLPPGTGDVQLSLTQATPVSAAVLVTTPQEVALRDVEKGFRMFEQVKVPVLGLIENLSFYRCSGCGKKHTPFGEGGGLRIAAEFGIPLLGSIPLDPQVPSELGKGEPLLVRDPDGEPGQAIREAAGRVAAELSRVQHGWAAPVPGAMEV